MYRVIVEFYDLTDGDRKYRVGDNFPRPGFSVSEERLTELSGDNNRLGRPLIEKVGEVAEEVTEEEPKPRRRRTTKE